MKYHVDIYIYNLRPRDKGRKLAWQGTWHENAKGTAQLRSFSVSVDERVWSWGVLVRRKSRPMYWGNVQREGTRITYMIMYCCMKRMRAFSIANMMTTDWERFKSPPSASEWTFGSAGKSNAVQNRSWGWEVGWRHADGVPGGLSNGQTACEPAWGS